MTHEEKISRLNFLKAAGFKGAALMALVSSCITPEDTFVPAETVTLYNTAPTNSTPAGGKGQPTSPNNPGGGTGGVSDGAPANGTNPSSVKSPLASVDLASTTAAKLKTVGGYIIVNSIVIARATNDLYVAGTQTCSHEPKKKIIYSEGEYYCTDHGARFTLGGKGLNSLGSGGLAIYKVHTDGKTLVVAAS